MRQCAKNAPMRQKIPLKCNFPFSILSSSPRPQGRERRMVIMKVVNKEVILAHWRILVPLSKGWGRGANNYSLNESLYKLRVWSRGVKGILCINNRYKEFCN